MKYCVCNQIQMDQDDDNNNNNVNELIKCIN